MSYQHKQKRCLLFIVVLMLLSIGNGCGQTPPTGLPTLIQTAYVTTTPSLIPSGTNTIQPDTWRDDTGYQGYYTGIVVITEYYTLLANGLPEEAYKLW